MNRKVPDLPDGMHKLVLEIKTYELMVAIKWILR